MSVPVVCRDAGICRGGGMGGVALTYLLSAPSPLPPSFFGVCTYPDLRMGVLRGGICTL